MRVPTAIEPGARQSVGESQGCRSRVEPGSRVVLGGQEPTCSGRESVVDDKLGRSGGRGDVSSAEAAPRSRISGLWVGLILSAIVLVFLLVFILQNGEAVRIAFLGWTGALPTGVALLFAAVAGVLLVAIPGSVRILQLRRATSGNGYLNPDDSGLRDRSARRARPEDRDLR